MTVTPLPKTTTKTISLTRTLKTWTRTAVVVTRTATASCTVPPRPRQPDPPCRFRPRLLRVPNGVNIPGGKRDEQAETYASVKKRLADIRARRAADIDARDLVKRSADARTITVTQTTLTVNQTVSLPYCRSLLKRGKDKKLISCRTPLPPPQPRSKTLSSAPSSSPRKHPLPPFPSPPSFLLIWHSTLPPATIKTGYAKATVTARAATKTKLTVTTAYIWQTRTMTARLTKVVTVTPTASVTACKRRGGHFGNGW